jgi:hypothetical protein
MNKNNEVPIEGRGSNGNENVAIEIDPLTQSSTQNENALEKLYAHFIKEDNGDPIPFGRWEKISLFLELLGGSGGIYAWPPAWQYSKNKAAWLAYSLTLTNPISNVLFLAKATDDLFDAVAMETKAPRALVDFIELPTKKNVVTKYAKMISGSIFCAIPFGVATYLFPLPNCNSPTCLGLIVAHSITANTILHAISWNFILTPAFWYYRLPIIPFEKAFKYWQNHHLTDKQKNRLSLNQELQVIYQKYKQHLSNFIIARSEEIVNDYVKNPNQEQDISLNEVFNGSLMTFSQKRASHNSLDEQPKNYSFLNRLFNTVHRFLSNGAIGFLGAVFMIIGTIGWIANPIYLGYQEGLNDEESFLAGILPAYTTAVLCAFYGSAIFNKIYGYFTSWPADKSDKLSLEAKLYPKLFSLFLLFNTYVAIFAYGTAQQLIITVFGSKVWDDYRPFLQGVSIPALQILSFVPLLDLFNSFVRKTVAKFGSRSSNHTLAARLLIKANAMSQRLQQMNGDKLISSIEQYSPQQMQTLGINSKDFNQDKTQIENLKRQIKKEKPKPKWEKSKNSSICSGCCTFWKSEKPEERVGLLNDPDETETLRYA